jgi:hypothetical protein
MSPISYFADNKRVSESMIGDILAGWTRGSYEASCHPSLSREDLCKGFCGCSYRRIGKPFQNRMGLVVATGS